jgi:hypothetical protein
MRGVGPNHPVGLAAETRKYRRIPCIERHAHLRRTADRTEPVMGAMVEAQIAWGRKPGRIAEPSCSHGESMGAGHGNPVCRNRRETLYRQCSAKCRRPPFTQTARWKQLVPLSQPRGFTVEREGCIANAAGRKSHTNRRRSKCPACRAGRRRPAARDHRLGLACQRLIQALGGADWRRRSGLGGLNRRRRIGGKFPRPYSCGSRAEPFRRLDRDPWHLSTRRPRLHGRPNG